MTISSHDKTKFRNIFECVKDHNLKAEVCLSTPEIRDRFIKNGFQFYLIRHETELILHYATDPQLKALLMTILNTGLCLEDALSLRFNSFILKSSTPYVTIQMQETGNNRKKTIKVPILCKKYASYIQCFNMRQKLLYRDKGYENQDAKIWTLTTNMALLLLAKLINKVIGEGVKIPRVISFNTFRSSFIIDMIVKNVEPTEICEITNDPEYKNIMLYRKLRKEIRKIY